MLPAMPLTAVSTAGPRRPFRRLQHQRPEGDVTQPTNASPMMTGQAVATMAGGEDSTDSSPLGFGALQLGGDFPPPLVDSEALLPSLAPEPWEDMVQQIVWTAGRAFSELQTFKSPCN